MNGHSTLYLSRFPRAQRGFTLVDLSIVLVIIGLLIGGILVGQSLISSAKINATVSQIQQFDAGVMAFKSQYNYLPGDAPAFGGNGNGAIEGGIQGWGSPWPNSGGIFGNEVMNFWRSLSAETFGTVIPGGLTKFKPSDAPQSKVGNLNSYFIASGLTADGWVVNTNPAENYYFIIPASQIAYQWVGIDISYFAPSVAGAGALKPAELLSLDSKIDDGQANSGNVIAGSLINSGFYTSGGITKQEQSNCSSGSAYQVQNIGYECTPLIRIGAQAGDPQ